MLRKTLYGLIGLYILATPFFVSANKILDSYVSKGVKGELSNISFLRLDIATARLLAEREEYKQSLDLLEKLDKIFPENYLVIIARANTENSAGNWHEAIELLEKAHQMKPEEPSVIAFRDSIVDAHKPYFSASYEFESRGRGATLRNFRVSNIYEFKPYVSFGTVLDHNDLNIDQLTQPKDGTVSQVTSNRYKGEVFLSYDLRKSSPAKASLYVGENGLGFGAEYPLYKNVSLHSEYQRPFWGFLEGLVNKGTRDKIELSYDKQIGRHIAFSSSAAINQYGLDGKMSLAKSRSLYISSRYTFFNDQPFMAWVGDKGYFSVGYTIDGEYTSAITNRANPAGATFTPLPLLTQEQHVLDISARAYVNDSIYLDGHFGRVIDRFADDAPIFGLSSTFKFNKDNELKMFGRRAVGTDNASEVVSTMGIQILKKF